MGPGRDKEQRCAAGNIRSLNFTLILSVGRDQRASSRRFWRSSKGKVVSRALTGSAAILVAVIPALLLAAEARATDMSTLDGSATSGANINGPQVEALSHSTRGVRSSPARALIQRQRLNRGVPQTPRASTQIAPKKPGKPPARFVARPGSKQAGNRRNSQPNPPPLIALQLVPHRAAPGLAGRLGTDAIWAAMATGALNRSPAMPSSQDMCSSRDCNRAT